MCGIVGYVGGAQAAPVLLDGLSRLEYRGYDSAGIAVRDESAAHIEVIKARGRLENLHRMTDGGRAVGGCCGVGHTRWATHGEPSVRNAHPHYSREKHVVLVHNGIIENYREIRELLSRRGGVFHTDTDTEAAALLLDDYYARERESGAPARERALSAIASMMARLSGSYALGILFFDQPGVIYAARKDSPLIAGRCGEGEGCILASDVPAVLPYTRSVVYIDNMEIAVMTRTELSVYNIDGEKVEKESVRIEWDAQAAEKGGYEHFMLKEIDEQPAAVRDTIAPRIREDENGMRSVDLSETGLGQEELAAVSRVLFVGCGSAYHAGLVGRCVTERLSRVPCSAQLASELRWRDAPQQQGTLCVVISQSGETADTLAALRLCREQGMKTLAIVNVVGSSIAREADAVLYTHAGPEIAVATTKAYAAQLAALYLLAIRLACARDALEGPRTQELLDGLLALPRRIKSALEDRTGIQWFASQFAHARDVFFIGRGLDCALCMEGSLKLKEISYIHSEAYAAGELKHGAISLIEDGTLVVAAATQPQLVKKTVCAMSEVRARGAYVFALMTEGEDAADAADFVVSLPPGEALFAASAAVVPLQLLAYYIACARGLDVDKPRNLAKSVTVE